MTSPTPANEPVDLDEQTAGDVARLADITRQIADLKEAAEVIKTGLRDRLAVGRRYRYAGVEVLDLGKIGSQFDATLAALHVPDALYTQICTPKPDAAKARRILPAELYAKCCTLRQPAVKTL